MNLESYLKQENIENSLSEVVLKLQFIAKRIGVAIHEEEKGASGFSNSHGEDQLGMDIFCDNLFLDNLKGFNQIATFVSEERDNEIINNESGKFTFAYDPIDGSSLVDTNLSIGSIFAIYPGKTVLGKKISEIICAGALVFGPRTTMIISFGKEVSEFTLHGDEFVITQKNMKISENTKMYSPGNLRAVSENPKYGKVLQKWLDENKTLRYSGGMVPDLNAIFCKGEGIFSYPGYSKYPNGKLRLTYEVGPFSFLSEVSGGFSLTEKGERILDLTISNIHQRSSIFIGSKNEVEEVINILNV